MAWLICMALKGIDVKLIPQIESGTDEFGNAIYKDGEPVTVHNVLVAPVSSQEQKEINDLYSKTASYSIAIPKGDTHTWTDQIVEFFGQRWHVFTLPQPGIESLVPLAWNDKYSVERYE